MTGAAEGLPAKTTFHDYLGLWNWDGALPRIHHALYVDLRERAGRARLLSHGRALVYGPALGYTTTVCVAETANPAGDAKVLAESGYCAM